MTARLAVGGRRRSSWDRRCLVAGVVAPCLLVAFASGAAAQGAAVPLRDAAGPVWPDAAPRGIQDRGSGLPQESEGGGVPVLGISKWAALAAAGGAAAYGFRVNARADREFAELEGICSRDVQRCLDRNPDGSFADPELEALFQEVVRLDDQARTALILGQVGIAVSLVLFILDLDDRGAPDIPYVPPRLTVAPGGGWLLQAGISLPRRGS